MTVHTFAIFTVERGPVYLWELRCKVSPKPITFRGGGQVVSEKINVVCQILWASPSAYCSANFELVIGFAAPANFMTYLSNVEGFV